MYCNLKQTVGSDFESGPIEVGTPQGAGYSGPFNYDAFRQAVEDYFRGNFGPTGSGIGFGAGAKNIWMYHNTIYKQVQVQFEASEQETSW